METTKFEAPGRQTRSQNTRMGATKEQGKTVAGQAKETFESSR